MALWLALSMPGSVAALDLPSVVSPQAHYLFYMHGAWIENGDPDALNPRYGRYRYDDIVAAFRLRGFEVISEARTHRVRTREYAKMVASLVEDLLDSGVPPEHVAVIGHSKGGAIALEVAAIVQNDAVRYVVMAGCALRGTDFRRGYDRFLQRRAAFMRGRILSIYDRADEITGTCDEAFAAAPLVAHREIVLATGMGHGLFYAPDPVWIDPVVDWIR